MTQARSVPVEPSQSENSLLAAVLNLSKYHRTTRSSHSTFPREQAIVLQRHARTLQALADVWSTADPARRQVLSTYEAAEDLNAPDAIQFVGVPFLEGEGRPAEITKHIRDLRTLGDDAHATGEWLATAMQASWNMAAALVPIDRLADVLGERHRIIANDWQAANMTPLAGRVLHRAAEMLDAIDFTPAALRADLAGERVASARLYSIAEMIGHAANLSSDAAGAELDSERRWRTFRARVREVVGREACALATMTTRPRPAGRRRALLESRDNEIGSLSPCSEYHCGLPATDHHPGPHLPYLRPHRTQERTAPRSGRHSAASAMTPPAKLSSAPPGIRHPLGTKSPSRTSNQGPAWTRVVGPRATIPHRGRGTRGRPRLRQPITPARLRPFRAALAWLLRVCG
jgi:hypothetical protein